MFSKIKYEAKEVSDLEFVPMVIAKGISIFRENTLKKDIYFKKTE